MLITVIVGMVSRVYTYGQAHQIVTLICAVYEYQVYLNMAVLKIQIPKAEPCPDISEGGNWTQVSWA